MCKSLHIKPALCPVSLFVLFEPRTGDLYWGGWRIQNVSPLQPLKLACYVCTVSVEWPTDIHPLQNSGWMIVIPVTFHYSPIKFGIKGEKGKKTNMCKSIGLMLNNSCQEGGTACSCLWACGVGDESEQQQWLTPFIERGKTAHKGIQFSETTWMKDLRRKVSQATVGSRPR